MKNRSYSDVVAARLRVCKSEQVPQSVRDRLEADFTLAAEEALVELSEKSLTAERVVKVFGEVIGGKQPRQRKASTPVKAPIPEEKS